MRRRDVRPAASDLACMLADNPLCAPRAPFPVLLAFHLAKTHLRRGSTGSKHQIRMRCGCARQSVKFEKAHESPAPIM